MFTGRQRRELAKTTWSRVMCDNGDNINIIQPNAFESASLDEMVPCDDLPEVDLSAWAAGRTS